MTTPTFEESRAWLREWREQMGGPFGAMERHLFNVLDFLDRAGEGAPEELRGIVAGLEGVTEGPWWADPEWSEEDRCFVIIAARTDCGPLPGNPTRGMIGFTSVILDEDIPQAKANAAHIARCSPSAMREIMAWAVAMVAEGDDLEVRRAANAAMAASRLQALETANARIAELEAELGINAKRNAEVRAAAGKPVGLSSIVNAEKHDFDPYLDGMLNRAKDGGREG